MRMFSLGPQRSPGLPKSSRPSRSFRSHSLIQPPKQLNHQQKNESHPSLLSMFQTSEGKIDFDKISGTVEQIRGLYGTFSPMLSRFIKR